MAVLMSGTKMSTRPQAEDELTCNQKACTTQNGLTSPDQGDHEKRPILIKVRPHAVSACVTVISHSNAGSYRKTNTIDRQDRTMLHRSLRRLPQKTHGRGLIARLSVHGALRASGTGNFGTHHASPRAQCGLVALQLREEICHLTSTTTAHPLLQLCGKHLQPQPCVHNEIHWALAAAASTGHKTSPTPPKDKSRTKWGTRSNRKTRDVGLRLANAHNKI